MTNRREKKVYLVVDQRERSVHGFIKAAFESEGHEVLFDQINTGDYLICAAVPGSPPEVLAVIERKTWADFAASLGDGRYANRHKMLDWRDRLGCQVYFFVEGAPFPAPGRRFARVPHAHILAAVTTLMVRDGVFVVQTADVQHTARRLLEFVKAFEKVDTPYCVPLVGGAPAPIDAPAPLTNNAPIDAPAPLDAPAPAPLTNNAPAPAPLDAPAPLIVPPIALGLVQKPDSEIVAKIWYSLPYVSLATAGAIMKQYSIIAFLNQSAEILKSLKTATGRALQKRSAVSLSRLLGHDKALSVKFLAGFPGLSPAMAACLLDTRTLRALLSAGPDDLAALTLTQSTRTVKFGKARAERTLRLAAYVIGLDSARPGAKP